MNTATYYRWEREVLGRTKDTQVTVKEKQGAREEVRFVELPAAGRNREQDYGERRIVAEVETAIGTIRFYEGANVEMVRALWEVASC